MTLKQIQNLLEKSGFNIDQTIEISRDQVKICVGYYEDNGYGHCDSKATNELADKINSILGWEPSWTQYNACILRPERPFDWTRELVKNNID